MKKLFVLLFLTLVLTSCGPSWVRGVIIDKQDRLPYTSVSLIPIRMGKTTSLMPVSTYHPEQWSFTIRMCETDQDAVPRNLNHCSEVYWQVPEGLYLQYDIGDRFDSREILP